MAIDQFQEKLDSRTLQYGEKGRVDKTRVFLCPRSTMATHRPKIGDYYGKAPATEGGAEIEGPSKVLCKSVGISNFGDKGDTGTVVITAAYSNYLEDSTSSGEDGDDQSGDEEDGGVGETTEFSLNFTVEYDMVSIDKDGKRIPTRLVRRPKAVLHVVMRRRARLGFNSIYDLIGHVNADEFLGSSWDESVLFDGCDIRKEGEYWIHEFDFIYMAMLIEDAGNSQSQIVTWNHPDVGNNCYPTAALDALGIRLSD